MEGKLQWFVVSESALLAEGVFLFGRGVVKRMDVGTHFIVSLMISYNKKSKTCKITKIFIISPFPPSSLFPLFPQPSLTFAHGCPSYYNNISSTMKKKIDSRIQTLIENGYKSNQRTMLMLVGDRSRYQVLNFHYILSKLSGNRSKPKVLWCYKNELEFSSHQKKRMQEIKNMQMKGLYDENVDDAFELFVSSNQIRYTYYKESHKILGNTYQMLILQDFQALTPNLLCRTIETVEGGGLVIFLMRTMTSLKQLHTITMDVHQRYRTDAHSEVQPRFNQRFLLSLSKNSNCIVMDDQLNILPISDHINEVKPVEEGTMINKKAFAQLENLKKSLESKDIIGKLISISKTLDQAKVIMALVDAIAQKSQKSTVSITAGRGRGKSASVGLAIAGAIQLGYSNIFVTAPSPDNLKTLFEFVCIGLELLDFKERQDFDKVYSNNKDYDRAVLRVDIFKRHTQFVQFVFPNDADKIGHSDLVIVDEAAAIPLPYVKTFFGAHNLFLASTINGYEGTGRSLSLKLLQQIRQKSARGNELNSFKRFREVSMTDPIRYALNDQIQRWLNELLLLNATDPVPLKGQRLPHPSQCQLYVINRDTLFSYKSSSEKFLFNLMSLFISSHYKNSPNDLQLLSDSPSHMIFALLGPINRNSDGKVELPDILCAVQLALQGNLSGLTINQNSQRGIKPSGDLIPWNIREQFQDNQFPKLAGGRIVRIATHAKAVKMGYGTRALQQLSHFFEGKLVSIQEGVQIIDYNFRGQGVRKPLLKKVDEVRPPQLNYLGTSFGFTQLLLKFWRKNGYEPVYLRQTVNDITSQHSGIMLKALQHEHKTIHVEHYVTDFKRRLTNLLGFQFRKLNVGLALEILHHAKQEVVSDQSDSNLMDRKVLQYFVSLSDLNRLKSYTKNQVDYHLVLDLIPTIAKLYFSGILGKSMNLGYINQAILVGIGLQMKTFDEICKEIKDLQVRNALPLFQKTVIKFTKLIQRCFQKQVIQAMPEQVTAQVNRALGNQVEITKDFATRQTEKIFEQRLQKQRSKIKYALDEEQQLPEQQVKGGEVLTIKRKLQNARDFNGSQGKKKQKK